MKTIGDAYMCAGGLLDNSKNHAVQTCLAALEIQLYMGRENQNREANGQTPWKLRIGIHTGSVISGVVGKNKFAFDVWGDSVNVASRMESGGEIGEVNLSESTYQHVKKYFECGPSRTLDVKNKGQMSTHFLTSLKPEYSANADGVTPNDKLKRALTGATTQWTLPS